MRGERDSIVTAEEARSRSRCRLNVNHSNNSEEKGRGDVSLKRRGKKTNKRGIHLGGGKRDFRSSGNVS